MAKEEIQRSVSEEITSELLRALESVEWIYCHYSMYCPWCGESKAMGHDKDCPRQLAIAKVKGENENESV